MNNLPAGAAGDARAPFNHFSENTEQCYACEGSGTFDIVNPTDGKLMSTEYCGRCDGTGQLPYDPSDSPDREYDKYEEFDHE
jgi:DnaJ-class molecular chaperone